MNIPKPLRLSGARLLEFDGDIATWVKITDGNAEVERVQMIEPVIERNKKLYNDNDYKRKGIKNEWCHFATWPNIIIEKWIIDYGINVLDRNHWKAALKKLEDPEWRYLKTTTGRIW